MPDVNPAAVVVNRGDDPEFVAAYIKYRELPHLVRGSENRADCRKGRKIRLADYPVPLEQRIARCRITGCKLDQPLFGNDMH